MIFPPKVSDDIAGYFDAGQNFNSYGKEEAPEQLAVAQFERRESFSNDPPLTSNAFCSGDPSPG
jgi:hypothetical protein